MKKSELQPGVEYAFGSTSRYDRYRAVKVTVVEVDGERERANGTTVKGIVVAGGGDLRRLAGYVSEAEVARVQSGEWVVRSGRYLREPWADFEEKVRRHEEAEAEKGEERKRRQEVAGEVRAKLRRLGLEDAFRVDPGQYRFSASADTMAKLLQRLDAKGA
jgi:hypothetical protein